MMACDTLSVPKVADLVLVVDDTASMRMLYRRVLELGGFRVLEADGAAEALELLARERPSLVLLDYMMPGTDGPGFLRILRERETGSRTPVVFLSAASGSEPMNRGFAAGADDYISKPVDPRVLVARVKSTIAAARERATAERARIIARQRNHLSTELEEGRKLQQRQLPQVPIEAGDWTIAGAVVPCGELGGDVFDVTQAPDGTVTAFVIDVAGHGLAAALVAASVRSVLRLLLAEHSPTEAMARLNRHLCASNEDRYACVAIVQVREETIEIVNAGMPPVCAISAAETARVWGAGTPPGLVPSATYESVRLSADEYTRIFVMSDGLTEPFGLADRVEGAVARLGLEEPWAGPLGKDLGARIALQFEGGQARPPDDATLLVLEAASKTATRRFDASLASIERAVDWAAARAPAWARTERLCFGLAEVIANAIVHGAFGLGSASRGEDLERQLDVIAACPPRPGAIAVTVEPSADACRIRVGWQGTACPRERRSGALPLDLVAPSGRGHTIVYASFDDVSWSEDGKEVTVTVERL
jgi:DNA-binding response OmpR family regulator